MANYFWHRYGFTIATAIDFLVIQTLLAGVWLESLLRHRRGHEHGAVAQRGDRGAVPVAGASAEL